MPKVIKIYTKNGNYIAFFLEGQGYDEVEIIGVEWIKTKNTVSTSIAYITSLMIKGESFEVVVSQY